MKLTKLTVAALVAVSLFWALVDCRRAIAAALLVVLAMLCSCSTVDWRLSGGASLLHVNGQRATADRQRLDAVGASGFGGRLDRTHVVSDDLDSVAWAAGPVYRHRLGGGAFGEVSIGAVRSFYGTGAYGSVGAGIDLGESWALGAEYSWARIEVLDVTGVSVFLSVRF